VGIVLALAALIFAAGIFSIGSEQRLWSRKVAYRIRLANTNGLQVGSPVRLVGVQVGSITDIVMPDDPNRSDIDVILKVDHAVESRIRMDTKATLKVLSLLGGEKFLELTPGSVSQPVLPPDSYIQVPEGMGIEEFQALGASIADDLQGITKGLKVVLDQLQNRETFLGQALFDPNFGKETLASFKGSMISADSILKKVDTGKGLAGRLLTDEKFADETVAGLEGSLHRVEQLLGRLADENGVAMQALAPDGSVSKILRNLQETSASLLRTAEEMKSGKGVAGRLVSDDAYAEQLLGDLKKTTENLKEITEKLNRGDGTAGAFINDPTLYRDLQDIVHGVQKSKMMSWFIRHYRKKGEKERMKEEEEKKSQDAQAGEGL
jgi:phospholipid/cholesterol/gamma-HCH transport system substrate-binding protein